MKYLALLLFAVLTTANTTEVIPYETLRDMYVKEEFFNSYGTLDSIRIFDKKLSAVDKEYQQQWTTEQIPILEDIKAKFLKLEDSAKDYTTLARCNNEGRNALCVQILARQEWLHRVIMRTDERILHLQHKAVTDDYAKILHAKGMEHRTWRHELTLILVLVAFQTYLGMMIMRWGWRADLD